MSENERSSTRRKRKRTYRERHAASVIARAKNELWELVTRGDHDDTSRSESGSILAQFVGQAAPEDAAPRTMSALTASATPPPPQQQLLERTKPFAQAAQRISSLLD